MRFVTILALLAFPIAEIWILINLAHHYGWWVLLYLVVIGWLGLQLIRDEKSFFSGRMMQSLSQGGNPIKAMMGSARNMVAGILLIIPGVLTDLMAVVLLLIPIKQEKFTSASMDSQASPEAVSYTHLDVYKRQTIGDLTVCPVSTAGASATVAIAA